MKALFKITLITTLLLMSSIASAYCVHYNSYGRCDQQDEYTVERDERIRTSSTKPTSVTPPPGFTSCNWVNINNRWQSICR